MRTHSSACIPNTKAKPHNGSSEERKQRQVRNAKLSFSTEEAKPHKRVCTYQLVLVAAESDAQSDGENDSECDGRAHDGQQRDRALKRLCFGVCRVIYREPTIGSFHGAQSVREI